MAVVVVVVVVELSSSGPDEATLYGTDLQQRRGRQVNKSVETGMSNSSRFSINFTLDVAKWELLRSSII